MKKTRTLSGKTLLRIILWVLSVLTLLNLVISASVVGLVGAVLILVMVWGVHRGDYQLASGLGAFLWVYAVINLVVLATMLLSENEAQVSALIWLGFYSLALLVLGALFCGKRLQSYLKTAKPPEKRESKFHFLHGGWRDL